MLAESPICDPSALLKAKKWNKLFVFWRNKHVVRGFIKDEVSRKIVVIFLFRVACAAKHLHVHFIVPTTL